MKDIYIYIYIYRCIALLVYCTVVGCIILTRLKKSSLINVTCPLINAHLLFDMHPEKVILNVRNWLHDLTLGI